MRDVFSAFVSNEMRMNIIKITSYKDRNFEGCIESPFLGEEKWFSNLTQMLFQLEEIADETNCPQRASERRSFKVSAAFMKDEVLESPPPESSVKPIASFKVLIMFRQNASWQGRCEWMNEQRSANFRSALELVQLMDGVLSKLWPQPR